MLKYKTRYDREKGVVEISELDQETGEYVVIGHGAGKEFSKERHALWLKGGK